jgi:hypothetical protein
MPRDTYNDRLDTPDRERAGTVKLASEITGLSTVTLNQMRLRGAGPPFFRIGRSVRYRLGDLLDWRDARTVGKAR